MGGGAPVPTAPGRHFVIKFWRIFRTMNVHLLTLLLPREFFLLINRSFFYKQKIVKGTIHLRRRHFLGGRDQKLDKFADVMDGPKCHVMVYVICTRDAPDDNRNEERKATKVFIYV